MSVSEHDARSVKVSYALLFFILRYGYRQLSGIAIVSMLTMAITDV